MKQLTVLVAAVASVVILVLGCDRNSENLLNQADDYLKKGNLSLARQKIDEAAQIDSLSPISQYGKALIEEYQGYEWEALISCLDAIKADRTFLPALEKFTQLAIRLDQRESARSTAEHICQAFPEKPNGYFYLATIDMLENKFDSAKINLAKAAPLTEDTTRIALMESDIAFHSGDAAAITAALNRLSRIRFSDTAHLEYLASLFHYLNMGDSSVFYIQKAVQKEKNDIFLKLQLGRYLLHEKYLAEAFKIAEDVYSTAEECGPAYILGAYIKSAMNHGLRSSQLFFEYLKIERQSPIGIEQHGDLYAYFHDAHNAQLEYHAAYILAVNKAYPKDYLSQLFVKMQNSFMDDGFISMAIDYFEEGKEMLPGSLDMYFLEAELKSHFKKVADSSKMMLDDQISKHWQDREWLAMAAKTSMRSGKVDQAFEVYTRLIELPHPKLIYYLELLEILKRRKDAAGADKIAENLPFRFRGNHNIKERLRDVYLITGRIDQAIDHCEWLYNRSTGYMPYITGLADLYNKRGNNDQARRIFLKYMEDYPDDPEGYYQMAKHEFYNGYPDSVFYRADQALAIDSNYGFALELKGLYHQENQDMDSALYYYRKTVDLMWPAALAYYNMAEYFFQTGDSLNRAAGLAMAAIRYLDRDSRGYRLLGNIYYAQEKYKLAKLQFFRAAKISPEDAECHFLLGRTLFHMNNKAEARKSLNKALELNLDPPLVDEARDLLTRL